MLHKKTISSNENQNTNKKLKKIWKKPNKIGLAYVEFYKNKNYIEVERGVQCELSKRSCHINWFLTKKTAERSKYTRQIAGK